MPQLQLLTCAPQLAVKVLVTPPSPSPSQSNQFHFRNRHHLNHVGQNPIIFITIIIRCNLDYNQLDNHFSVQLYKTVHMIVNNH